MTKTRKTTSTAAARQTKQTHGRRASRSRSRSHMVKKRGGQEELSPRKRRMEVVDLTEEEEGGKGGSGVAMAAGASSSSSSFSSAAAAAVAAAAGDEENEEEEEEEEEEEGENGEEEEAYAYSYRSDDDDYEYVDNFETSELPPVPPSSACASSSSRPSADGGLAMDVSGSMGSGKKGKAASGYRVLTHEDLAAQQAGLVAEVMELLDVREPLPAKLLLRKWRWDVASVMENFEDATRFLRHLREQQQASTGQAGGKKEGERKGEGATFTCQICFDDCPASDGVALACAHAYCKDCVLSHLLVKIEEAATKRLSCPTPKCPQLYDEATVQSMVGAETEAGKKLSKQSLEYFLMDNPRVKGCPGPDCSLYAELRDSGSTAPVVIHCPDCAHRWCFACSRPPHFALPCAYAKQWGERTADEDEMKTIELLKRETKQCPWCGYGVHKFDGCNFMTCRCGRNWCWKCGGKGHECGRITGQGGSAASDTVRFMHYLQQFRAQGLLDEGEAIARGAEREEVEDIRLVNKARKALANSYAAAYYLFMPSSASSSSSSSGGSGTKDGGSSTNPLAARLTLFEDKQQRLEQETEAFARMLSEMHLAPSSKKRPKDVDIKTQRGKLLHWLEALHGTMEHDVLQSEAFGIRIPKFDLAAI